MYDIRKSGCIRLTLDFGVNRIHEVIAIPIIQFIIEYCKGNDFVCGRILGMTLSEHELEILQQPKVETYTTFVY